MTDLYICSITGKGINSDLVWFCSSVTEKEGEKYDHVSNSDKALRLTAYQAKVYRNYYQKLGYTVRTINVTR